MSKYSKINFVYFLQKWMDSVPGQTFLNYAYSWGAAVVILGTLFKLTYLPGANVMLFLGMGTEVFVFFISAFDRPFDKSSIDMPLDNHMDDQTIDNMLVNPMGDNGSVPQQQVPMGTPVQGGYVGGPVVGGGPVVSGGPVVTGGTQVAASAPVSVGTTESADAAPVTGGATVVGNAPVYGGGTVIIGTGAPTATPMSSASETSSSSETGITENETESPVVVATSGTITPQPQIFTPAPAVSPETAAEMEEVTTEYIKRLRELNEMLEKVGQLTARLSTDSEEMENLNRTLTGISRVYEMQLKSASQQITTQDEINDQTRRMAEQIKELNSIYTRMIEAMTVNMPGAAKA